MVTDADRRAAASIAVLPEMRELILAGKVDHHAEPFSAHRLAAEARAEKLVEALEGWADWHRKACIDSDDDLTYINGDGWADAGKLAEQARAALSEYAGERR